MRHGDAVPAMRLVTLWRRGGARLRQCKAYLAGEAIASYVELNVWQVAHIKRAFEEDESGAPGVPHHEVVAWIESWGTDHELPMPVSKKR
jgi:predicted transcriptional regulator